MTKRVDLLKKIRQHALARGEELRIVEGANHTRVWIGESYTTIPRHREIPDRFAKKILKQIGVE